MKKRHTIIIDEKLLNECRAILGKTGKRELSAAVEEAIRCFVEGKKRVEKALRLAGTINYIGEDQ